MLLRTYFVVVVQHINDKRHSQPLGREQRVSESARV